MYELLTGRLPIQGNSFPEIINGHLSKTPPEPSSVNPAIPGPLSAATMKSLAKNRDQRFQNASEFLRALEHVRADSTTDWAVTMEKTFVTTGSPLPGNRASDPTQKQYDQAVLEDISKQLAHYIGPIAKVVVKRASSSSNNLRELCDKVAREIDSEKRRDNFLVTVRKHLRASGEL